MVVSIDGMSASGKSTLAFMLANKLKLKYLNSGSIYRCIALKIMNKEILLDDKDLENKILNLDIDFDIVNDRQVTYLDGVDVTDKIRLEEVSIFTPEIANNKIIKPAIRKIQKKFVDAGNVVIEGRDIGTRIAPKAEYKFYLYTDIDVRTKRLFEGIKDKQNVTLVDLKRDLINRDNKDIDDGNFIKPENAFEIDTSYKTIEEVLDEMLMYIRKER